VPASPGFTIRRYRPRNEGLFARIERWAPAGVPRAGGEWTPQLHNTLSDEGIHERRVLDEAGLLMQW